MNKRMIMLMAAALALLSASGQVEFSGASDSVIEITPELNTGVDKIYVVYNTQGVSMTYTATTDEAVIWKCYDLNNSRYPEEIDVSRVGSTTSLTLDGSWPGRGYIIEEGIRSFKFWVVNYADYFLHINEMSFNTDCSLMTIDFDGQGANIPYARAYSDNRYVLDREIKLHYNTLVWEGGTWVEQAVDTSFVSLEQIILETPLCNTEFRLSGDRFLEHWDKGLTIPLYFRTQAVDCRTTATLIDDDNTGSNSDTGGDDDSDDDNQSDGNVFRGSAPLNIVFTVETTDAAVSTVWEMSEDIEFLTAVDPIGYNDELDYTFNETGTFYIRCKVENTDRTCEAYGEVYTVTVGESEMTLNASIPNAFSPGTTPEVNDVWKVPIVKSMVEFHCWIYNRWGQLVYEFTDPDGGWDGTCNGKLVDTGVYYFVITALGSDGVKYKRHGDISILRFGKEYGGTTSDSQGGSIGGDGE